MSAHAGPATAFRIPSVSPESADACASVSCEIGAATTDPSVVAAAVAAGLAAFLAFAYVRDAAEVARNERDRVLAERDAFAAFADRVETLESTPPGPPSAGVTGSAAVRTVDRGASVGDVRLRRVLAAYRDTVMSVPHYREEYDETVAESLAAELGPDTTVALASDGTLSAGSQSALVRRGRQAADARAALAETIDAEIDALRAFDRDLDGVDRRRRRLLEHLDGVSGDGTDAAIDVWERLDDLTRECDGIAADRQAAIADPSARSNSRIDDGEAFYEYLYGSTPGPQHPVLAAAADLAESIRADCDRVASRLAGDRSP